MTTPVNTITKTQASLQNLLFAHRWLFKKHPDLHEELWATMLFEHGYRFASIFSDLFEGKEKMIEDILITTPPVEGEPHNWFWMWWKLKWMQDDWDYINNKVYLQAVSYEQYKTFMLNNEMLEQDLLSLLCSKQLF